MSRYSLSLSGLKCMGCAHKVENALNDAFDIRIIQLSPESLQAETNADSDEIIRTIQKLGYDAQLSDNDPVSHISNNHYQFDLSGLHCGNCVKKVRTALEASNDNQNIDIDTQHLSLVSALPAEKIVQQIEELGYQASLHEPATNDDTAQHYQFDLSGLHCGNCVKKVRTALEASSDNQNIDIDTQHLSLVSALPAEKIVQQIEELGYQAQLAGSKPTPSEQVERESQQTEDFTASDGDATTNLLISGMSCASCVASVDKALRSVSGVDKAQVNLAEQSALVFSERHDESFHKALEKAVQEAGYQAEIIDDPAMQQEKQAQQQQRIQKLHRNNAIIGLVVGIPLMLWGVLGGNMLVRNPQDQIAWGAAGLVCLLLLATAGRNFYVNAWQSLTHKRATMDTLVALGTGAAWLYSMLVVLIPDWFPLQARHVYFEASAMIIGLISLGHYIEAKAKAKTARSLQALINLQPQMATLVTEHGDETIAAAAIRLGMQLRIKPGEKIPVDGKVLSGQSYIDESMLTGEPIAAFKEQGQKVAAGTLNKDGSLLIEATGVGANTMLARIIRMVRQAQSSKPAIAKLADEISSVFVPVVVVIALFSAAIWYIYGPDPKASYMLVIATTVLIIACPCALGLATPLSVTVGVGKAAEMGILIRDANVLQSASKINTVVFDKTGTLTQGNPEVQKVFPLNGDPRTLLKLAYSAECHSEHPLAKAVCDYAVQKSITASEPQAFNNIRGRGIQATVDGHDVLIASLQYFEQQNIALSSAEEAIAECAQQAWTPVAIALNGTIAGIIAIADPLKNESVQAIKALKAQGIQTVILTGDNQSVAAAIGQQLGVDKVISQVLPDEKAEHIKQLQQNGAKVAMIGDGINDAPALAQADIGIAMGSGSDVAIESAQMTLLNSSPMAVLQAIRLSKATIKNMKQNLFGAFVYNSLGIPLAAGVLYPFFGFLLNPVIAGTAMALSSITVVSNANRLRLFKTEQNS